ncbi:MAG: DedA family protein [bacterium]|nr:DedA family protein [bacterium]
MEVVSFLIDFVLHLDKHLVEIISEYGTWTYAILFLVIFCETGLVVTPFLPGDSLLFVAGALAAAGSFDVFLLFGLLFAAAVLGDNTNYAIGNYLGPKVFSKTNSKIFRKEYLDKTHKFFEKYGVKTIIIARFVPIVRTFTPFIAGVGKMSYWKFLSFDLVGGLIWIGSLVFAGFFFGNIPFIKNNLSFVIIAIILLSVLPAIIEVIREKRKTR